MEQMCQMNIFSLYVIILGVVLYGTEEADA
jgi:hypothetical protein